MKPSFHHSIIPFFQHSILPTFHYSNPICQYRLRKNPLSSNFLQRDKSAISSGFTCAALSLSPCWAINLITEATPSIVGQGFFGSSATMFSYAFSTCSCLLSLRLRARLLRTISLFEGLGPNATPSIVALATFSTNCGFDFSMLRATTIPAGG